MTTITAGSTVSFDRGRTGTVTHVGVCGFPRCAHGAECVTIRPHGKGSFTTVNRAVAQVEAVVA